MPLGYQWPSDAVGWTRVSAYGRPAVIGHARNLMGPVQHSEYSSHASSARGSASATTMSLKYEVPVLATKVTLYENVYGGSITKVWLHDASRVDEWTQSSDAWVLVHTDSPSWSGTYVTQDIVIDPSTHAFLTDGVMIELPPHASYEINAVQLHGNAFDALVTYTAASAATSGDSFSLSVSDGESTSAPFTVAVARPARPALPAPAWPTSITDTTTTRADTPIRLALSAAGDGRPVRVQVASQPAKGTISLVDAYVEAEPRLGYQYPVEVIDQSSTDVALDFYVSSLLWHPNVDLDQVTGGYFYKVGMFEAFSPGTQDAFGYVVLRFATPVQATRVSVVFTHGGYDPITSVHIHRTTSVNAADFAYPSADWVEVYTSTGSAQTMPFTRDVAIDASTYSFLTDAVRIGFDSTLGNNASPEFLMHSVRLDGQSYAVGAAYVPNAGETGVIVDSVGLTITDGLATSATLSVSLSVSAPDTPTAVQSPAAMAVDAATIHNVPLIVRSNAQPRKLVVTSEPTNGDLFYSDGKFFEPMANPDVPVDTLTQWAETLVYSSCDYAGPDGHWAPKYILGEADIAPAREGNNQYMSWFCYNANTIIVRFARPVVATAVHAHIVWKANQIDEIYIHDSTSSSDYSDGSAAWVLVDDHTPLDDPTLEYVKHTAVVDESAHSFLTDGVKIVTGGTSMAIDAVELVGYTFDAEMLSYRGHGSATPFVDSVTVAMSDGRKQSADFTITFNVDDSVGAPGTPAVPSTSWADNKLSLSWVAPSGSPTVYSVYKNGKLLEDATGLTFEVGAIDVQVDHSYQVVARNANGASFFSPAVEFASFTVAMPTQFAVGSEPIAVTVSTAAPRTIDVTASAASCTVSGGALSFSASTSAAFTMVCNSAGPVTLVLEVTGGADAGAFPTFGTATGWTVVEPLQVSPVAPSPLYLNAIPRDVTVTLASAADVAFAVAALTGSATFASTPLSFANPSLAEQFQVSATATGALQIDLTVSGGADRVLFAQTTAANAITVLPSIVVTSDIPTYIVDGAAAVTVTVTLAEPSTVTFFIAITAGNAAPAPASVVFASSTTATFTLSSSTIGGITVDLQPISGADMYKFDAHTIFSDTSVVATVPTSTITSDLPGTIYTGGAPLAVTVTLSSARRVIFAFAVTAGSGTVSPATYEFDNTDTVTVYVSSTADIGSFEITATATGGVHEVEFPSPTVFAAASVPTLAATLSVPSIVFANAPAESATLTLGGALPTLVYAQTATSNGDVTSSAPIIFDGSASTVPFTVGAVAVTGASTITLEASGADAWKYPATLTLSFTVIDRLTVSNNAPATLYEGATATPVTLSLTMTVTATLTLAVVSGNVDIVGSPLTLVGASSVTGLTLRGTGTGAFTISIAASGTDADKIAPGQIISGNIASATSVSVDLSADVHALALPLPVAVTLGEASSVDFGIAVTGGTLTTASSLSFAASATETLALTGLSAGAYDIVLTVAGGADAAKFAQSTTVSSAVVVARTVSSSLPSTVYVSALPLPVNVVLGSASTVSLATSVGTGAATLSVPTLAYTAATTAALTVTPTSVGPLQIDLVPAAGADQYKVPATTALSATAAAATAISSDLPATLYAGASATTVTVTLGTARTVTFSCTVTSGGVVVSTATLAFAAATSASVDVQPQTNGAFAIDLVPVSGADMYTVAALTTLSGAVVAPVSIASNLPATLYNGAAATTVTVTVGSALDVAFALTPSAGLSLSASTISFSGSTTATFDVSGIADGAATITLAPSGTDANRVVASTMLTATVAAATAVDVQFPATLYASALPRAISVELGAASTVSFAIAVTSGTAALGSASVDYAGATTDSFDLSSTVSGTPVALRLVPSGTDAYKFAATTDVSVPVADPVSFSLSPGSYVVTGGSAATLTVTASESSTVDIAVSLSGAAAAFDGSSTLSFVGTTTATIDILGQADGDVFLTLVPSGQADQFKAAGSTVLTVTSNAPIGFSHDLPATLFETADTPMQITLSEAATVSFAVTVTVGSVQIPANVDFAGASTAAVTVRGLAVGSYSISFVPSGTDAYKFLPASWTQRQATKRRHR